MTESYIINILDCGLSQKRQDLWGRGKITFISSQWIASVLEGVKYSLPMSSGRCAILGTLCAIANNSTALT